MGGKCYICKQEMTEQEINNGEIDFDVESAFALIIHKRCKNTK